MQLFPFQSEHEIRRKAIGVARNGFVEITGRDAVELRQIGIEQHFFAAQKSNCLRDALDWNDFLIHAKSRAI